MTCLHHLLSRITASVSLLCPAPGLVPPWLQLLHQQESALTKKCQALPARSAAEQFLSGALCEPAWLLIYLLVKEITIAIITGRCVSTVRNRTE